MASVLWDAGNYLFLEKVIEAKGSFLVVPAPGVIAAFVLAGAVGVRRRR